MTDPLHSRSAVACPFCSLLCDDLTVVPGRPPHVTANGCARARQLFERPLPDAPALIDGRPVDRETAIRHAAGLLRHARQPLVAGLGTDVAGMRAALELAERSRAILDPMHSDALFRNLRVLQQTGWITGTLSEIRNRADVILLVGDRLPTRFPRLVERTFGASAPLFVAPADRHVVCLGGALDLPGLSTASVPFALSRLAEVVAALRALLRSRRLDATEVAGVPIAALAALADRLRAAKYSAVLWAAADLKDAGDELAVQQLAELVRDLNETTRSIGVPLAGGESDLTTQQVTTWQTGYPGRVSFARGVPDYDPDRFATVRLLANGEVDVLLWISAFDPLRLPPAGNAPVIVLGPPDMQPPPAGVFLPVATPGLHHTGHLFRTDSVVTLPLRRLSDTALPSVAHTLRALCAALASKESTPC